MRLLVSLAALVIVLSGCAAPSPVPTPTPTQTSEPAPTPTVAPESGCATLFPATDVEALIGPATPNTVLLNGAPDPVYGTPELAGGWGCRLQGATGWASLVVLPADVMLQPGAAECEQGWGCKFGGAAAGIGFWAVISDGRGDAATSAAADAVTASFGERVAGFELTAPAGVDPAACPLLDGWSVSPYSGDAEPNPGYYSALRLAGLMWCVISDDQGLRAQAFRLPGGAEFEPEIVLASTAGELSDGTAAWLTPGSVIVLRGGDWFQVRAGDPAILDAVMLALLAAG